MEPISLNHIDYVSSANRSSGELKFTEQVRHSTGTSLADQVTLSPVSVVLSEVDRVVSRFSSMEEQSVSKTKQVNSWLTLEELESGSRRPFTDPEDLRLSTLTLKELMVEVSHLPRIDQHGHLQNSFAGTAQGDRLGTAMANINLQAQYDYQKASEALGESVDDYKRYIATELGIDANEYDIKLVDGKITVFGRGDGVLNSSGIRKIQSMLDSPEAKSPEESLLSVIDLFNRTASALINNLLIRTTMGSSPNPYLPKELDVDEIMNGVNYSSGSATSHLGSKWLDVVDNANNAYRVALEDGSHLENYSIPAGLLELMRFQNSK